MNDQYDRGETIFNVIQWLDPSVKLTPHLYARSAGRFLEEAVELALAFGLTPSGILGHITDAIHNEARKAGVYPSEMKPQPLPQEQLVELGDVWVCTDYLRHLIGAREEDVLRAADHKIRRMITSAASGEAHIVDGLFYRKTAGRAAAG
jgi:hypothetical protein